MGTHPIFESDFDCLTEMVRATAGLRSVKALVEAKAVQNVYTNGITAVNMAPASDACQVAISLNAGSANESAANAGAATFTRYCLGLSNHRNTTLLQQRMVGYMGAKFETFGTRERTTISVTAGPKAIEELTLDVLVPSLLSPMFYKYELFFPWDQAKRAANCPVDEAFHQASFSGGLSNKLGFYGGYGSDNARMLEERDEILEDLGRNFHYNHYGMDGAIIASSGVSDDFLDKVANALDASPFKNVAGAASKFHAGQVRMAGKGASKAVVGIDCSGADAASAAVVAAALGGKVLSYANVQVVQFSAASADELESKLNGLSTLNLDDAIANATLAQLLTLSEGSSAAVKAVANAQPLADVSSVDGGAVSALASSLQSAPKSMVVVGDVHAFPQNTEI